MSVDQLQDYGLERMKDEQIREFLTSHSTGVLGLPAEGVPYMIPMSYAHDDASLYFTYLLGPSSNKGTLSQRADRARFLVYSVETMFNWRSVLLGGPLSQVPEAEWSDLEDVLTNAWRPELFKNAGAAGSVEVYELEIQAQDGIRHTGLARGFQESIDY